MTLAEIAKSECATIASVQESIVRAKKRCIKIFVFRLHFWLTSELIGEGIFHSPSLDLENYIDSGASTLTHVIAHKMRRHDGW